MGRCVSTDKEKQEIVDKLLEPVCKVLDPIFERLDVLNILYPNYYEVTASKEEIERGIRIKVDVRLKK